MKKSGRARWICARRCAWCCFDLIDAQKERPPHFSVMVALSTIQIEMLYLWGVPTQTDRRAAIADPEEIREWLHAFVDLIIDRGRFDLSPPKDLLQ